MIWKNGLEQDVLLATTNLGKRKSCPACNEDEMVVTNDRLCRICGEELVVESQTTMNSSSSNDTRLLSDATSFFDLMGEDLRVAIAESLSQTLPGRQISQAYLTTLGKVTLDTRRSLLYDIILQIGPITIMATPGPGMFAPLPPTDTLISSQIVLGDPEFGENEIFINSNECKDSFVILKRGKVSFAKKALNAQRSGASVVIICQNTDVWPFMMTDEGMEINEYNLLTIPVVMISKKDSELVIQMKERADNMIKHNKKSAINNNTEMDNIANNNQVVPLSLSDANSNNEINPQNLICKLRCGQQDLVCSICQEDMIEGNVVLKLACRHAYHGDCVQTWLDTHNTCPMCRHEMPVLTINEESNLRRRNSNQNNEAQTNQMPYFF